jgi:hypothetical protein
MEQTGHVAGWVDQLDDMAVAVTDAMLRAGGGVAAPTVHVLVDGLDPAYVGKLGCRAFYRGRDAHAAVAVMGLFGSRAASTTTTPVGACSAAGSSHASAISACS